ncbi:hypothetical protein D3C80_2012790 [compost metagenome]
MPCGKIAPSATTCANEAWTPEGETKEVNTITSPVKINAPMAMTLIKANQNSISPKTLTANKFNPSNTTKTPNAGIQVGRSGYQNCR